MTDLASVREQVNQIQWFHTIDLGNGIVTPGATKQDHVLPRLHLPQRLDGKRVLDVGAWDGYYSFEAERRGGHVLATDHFCWSGPGWGSKAGFDLAHEVLDSKVEALDIDPMELSPDILGGTFDVVLLLGVLYHVKSPIDVLERVRSVTDGMMILETEGGMLFTRRPAAAFFPGTELNNDPTNWWAPNVSATLGMLRAVGFDRVEVLYRGNPMRRLASWARHLRGDHRISLSQALTTDRIVYHAWT